MMKKGRKILVALTLAMLLIATTVLVACGDNDTPPVSDTYAITVNKDTLSLAEGAEYQLTAEVKKNGTVVNDAVVAWKSENTAKATVSSSGLVRAVAAGSSVITASFEGGGTKYSAGCTLTVTAPTYDAVAWTKPETKITLQNDVIKFRLDRQSKIETMLSELVTAKQGENDLQVIADLDEFVPDSATNLYTIGDFEITYKTRTAQETTETTTYTIEVVEGKTVDYYLYGKNSETFTNQYFTGGNAIRVAREDVLEIPVGSTEMPAKFLNSSNNKLLDYDDAMLVINKSENDITFKVNDVAGVHIHMDKAGVVKTIFEGIQNDFWSADGQSKMTPSVYGDRDIVLESGDFYFVVGNTADGNYYFKHETSTNEKHWRDGRFVALNTVGGKRAGNVAKIVCGENTLTEAYSNQLPYLYSGGDTIQIIQNEALPTDFKADIVFYDDGGAWGVDAAVNKDNIAVANDIDNTTLGEYTITYTVTDDTDSSKTITYSRKAKVVAPLMTYLRYSVGEVKNTREIKKIYLNEPYYNGADNDSLFIYDSNFAGVKFDSVQFNAFLIVDSNWKVTAFLSADKSFWDISGKKVTFGTDGKNQLRHFKLNAQDAAVDADDSQYYTLKAGEKLIFGRHTVVAANVRDFINSYTLAVKNAANSGTTFEEKAYPITFNLNMNYEVAGQIKFNNAARILYNDPTAYGTAPGKNLSLFVYDSNFAGVKPNNVSYTNIVLMGANGKVKAMINANGGFVGSDGAMVTAGYGNTNQLQYFKLNSKDTAIAANFVELVPGDKLIFGRHTGADDTDSLQVNNLRAFFNAYIDAVKNNAGADLAAKSITLNMPLLGTVAKFETPTVAAEGAVITIGTVPAVGIYDVYKDGTEIANYYGSIKVSTDGSWIFGIMDKETLEIATVILSGTLAEGKIVLTLTESGSYVVNCYDYLELGIKTSDFSTAAIITIAA